MTTQQQIEEITEAIVSNYEFSCEWAKAASEGVQACNDLGIKPRKSLILHCVNLAKMQWMKISMDVQKEINA